MKYPDLERDLVRLVSRSNLVGHRPNASELRDQLTEPRPSMATIHDRLRTLAARGRLKRVDRDATGLRWSPGNGEA